MKIHLKAYLKAGLMPLLVLSLMACSNEQGNLDRANQIEDLEMVITAEQGRVQNLEKDLTDLKAQLTVALEKIDKLEEASTRGATDSGLSDQLKKENAELVRLIFQSLTDDLDMEGLKGLISTYENVYKLAQSPQEDKDLIWVTGHENVGDLYMLHKEQGGYTRAKPVYLGRYDNLTLAKWSPDNNHVIIETEIDGQLKGHLINTNTQESLATMEYTSLPIWGPKGTFFVYLNDNPNELYTGTETTDMYATGVFMYSFKSKSFSVVDPGGSDYICKDLGVKSSGEITYIQMYKEGKQSYASVLID